MKKRVFGAALLITALPLFLSGCGKDDGIGDELQITDTPVVLTGRAYTFEKDKGVIWTSGKRIGVYMLQEDGKTLLDPYQNVPYQSITVPEGYFAPINAEDVIHLAKDGTRSNLIAYYPYQEAVTENRIGMNVSNQKSSAAFSFLYSNNCKGANKDHNKVAMQLHPVLSQITFNLKCGDGVSDEYLEDATVTLKGMYTKADFNILSGEFENRDAIKDMVMVPQKEVKGDTALVIPSSSVEGYLAHVSLPKMNREYTWKLSDELTELKQGIRYICTGTVSLDKIEVETTEEAIGDWQDGNQTTGSLKENWILTTINDLPTGDLKVETVNDKPWQYEIDKWIFLSKGLTQPGTATVQYEPTVGQNIIYYKVNDNNTWYKTFIAYRLQRPKREKYTIKFKAKGSAGKQVKCLIYRQDGSFIMLDRDYKPGEAYKGAYSFNLTNDYTEYQADFDCSKQIKSVWDTSTDYIESTDEVLDNLFIQFSPTTNNVDLYLYDLSLELKKNK